MRLVAVAAPPLLEAGGFGLAADAPLADLVEARLDLDPMIDISAILLSQEVLATVRSCAEGGAFDGDRSARAARLHAAARRDGASWIDAETDVAAVLDALPARILASMHGTRPIDLPRDCVAAWKVARPVTDGFCPVLCGGLCRRGQVPAQPSK